LKILKRWIKPIVVDAQRI